MPPRVLGPVTPRKGLSPAQPRLCRAGLPGLHGWAALRIGPALDSRLRPIRARADRPLGPLAARAARP